MNVSRLRLERVKQGKTQSDVFLATGIPQWRVSLLERGIPPKDEEARKLARFLKVPSKALFNATAVRAYRAT